MSDGMINDLEEESIFGDLLRAMVERFHKDHWPGHGASPETCHACNMAAEAALDVVSNESSHSFQRGFRMGAEEGTARAREAVKALNDVADLIEARTKEKS